MSYCASDHLIPLASDAGLHFWIPDCELALDIFFFKLMRRIARSVDVVAAAAGKGEGESEDHVHVMHIGMSSPLRP